ncbi:hypothetical protein [Mycoplasmopsis adleri]|uniref:hypothetical protein n=1 Tax=Mycoplasmopsis adleri TaxID=51362 RepID=UPI003872F4B4
MILINFFLSLAIGGILLAFYRYVKMSLMLGFLIGSALSFIFYEIRDLFTYFAISKSKKGVISFNILAFTIIALLALGMTFMILKINEMSIKNATNLYMKYKFQIAFYPINIIAFLGGLLMTKISIFLAIMLNKKRKEA